MCKRLSALTLLSVAVAMWAAGAFAEAPDTLWMRTYGGSASDGAYSIQETADGGFIVTGRMSSTATGDDVYLVKTDSEGCKLWERTYGGADTERGRAVCESPGGGFLIAGYTNSFGNGGQDVYVLRVDSDGSVLWCKTYGGAGDDVAYAAKPTADGGFILAGCTTSFGAGMNDVYLLRLDSEGDTLWTCTYGGVMDDSGCGVEQIPSGGFVVAGRTGSYGAGANDVWLLKTDPEGELVWSERYGSSWDDFGYSVDLAPDGGYVIVGTSELINDGPSQVYIVKTDSLGHSDWTRTYGGADVESGNSVRTLPDGGYLVAGWTKSFGAGFWDLYVLRLTTDGDTVWSGAYGGTKTDAGYSLELTSDGSFVVAGWTASFGAGDTDLWMVKMAPDLSAIDWESTPESPDLQMSVLPNPTAGPVTIEWGAGVQRRPTVFIYDIAGREVAELKQGQLSQPTSLFWNGRDRAHKPVSPGIYFIRLQAGDQVATRKVVLVR